MLQIHHNFIKPYGIKGKDTHRSNGIDTKLGNDKLGGLLRKYHEKAKHDFVKKLDGLIKYVNIINDWDSIGLFQTRTKGLMYPHRRDFTQMRILMDAI